MIIQATSHQIQNFGRIAIKCPNCGRDGTFDRVGDVNDIKVGKHGLGQRICPNTKCKTHVFIIVDENNEVIVSYPPQRIDFDKTDIPAKVVSTFEETISAHANNCYIASAIMVRRTLEEICEDKNSTGKNLKDRIATLAKSIILPQELLEGMDELRVLGNDAAHIEAKVYENIGKRELDVAIKFTKEILKSVYQYSSLLSELKALKSKDNSQ